MLSESWQKILQQSLANPAPGYVFFGARESALSASTDFIKNLLNLAPSQLTTSHPDFSSLPFVEDKSTYSIEILRDFLKELHQRPVSAPRRLAFIDRADLLNLACYNALLKDVESAQHLIFIFIVSRLSILPATLLSRLVAVPCDPLARISSDPAGSLLLQVSSATSLGQAFAFIDQAAKLCESADFPTTAWQNALTFAMQNWSFESQDSQKFARGLVEAWHLIGSALSPRFALEKSLL